MNPESNQCITIVGKGRIGCAIAQMAGQVQLIGRGEPIPAEGTGPIVVCTRNDALEDVIHRTPPVRRPDLVFVQNGMIFPLLSKAGLQDTSQALLYFAVQKLGDAPVDGGGTVVTGPWASEMVHVFRRGGIESKVVTTSVFRQHSLEKLLWNCIYCLLSEYHSLPVGEVAVQHPEPIKRLLGELGPVGEEALDVKLPDDVFERLQAYSRSIHDYRGAVKEWPWRNGWFLETKPTPYHKELCRSLGYF